MSIIVKPNTFVAGTEANASEVNANFDTIYNDYNGGIAAGNLATDAVTTAKIASEAVTTAKLGPDAVTSAKVADAAILPENLVTGAGTSWAWQTWVPTLSGRFDNADWTKDCKYIQIGKTVIFQLNLIAADSAPMGGGSANAIFTLPVTAATIPGTDTRMVFGEGFLTDASATGTKAMLQFGSTTTGIIYALQVSGANIINSAITSTAPFTWTTSDEIGMWGVYEAA